MSRSGAARLGIAALAAAAVALPASARAQGAQSERTLPIIFEVIVVHGSTREGTIEASCAGIHSRLKMMHFRSLRMVQQQIFSLDMGQPVGMRLPTGQELRLMPIAVLKERLHLQFEVPGVVNTRGSSPTSKPAEAPPRSGFCCQPAFYLWTCFFQEPIVAIADTSFTPEIPRSRSRSARF